MTKPYKDLDEQIEILKERGLIIKDDKCAKSTLETLNYYRLSGYTLTMRNGNTFYSDAKFSDAMQIYHFDQELKYVLLYHLEEVEISLRTHLAYILGQYGGESYLKPDYYMSQEHRDQFMTEIHRALKDNRNEAFVKHHNTSYGGILPIWALVETLSFGTLSRLFSALNTSVKKEICENYYGNIRYTYITSWLESLVVIRNLCAHHSRIYNRGIPLTPPFCQEDRDFFVESGYDGNSIGKRVFFHLIILCRMSGSDDTETKLISSIIRLKEIYPFTDLKHYGFKYNWIDLLHKSNQKYKKISVGSSAENDT